MLMRYRPFDAERALLDRMVRGDERALAEVVARYEARVFRVVYGIVRDAHEVEDVAQQVFWKVWRRIDSFDRRARFSSWLFRVAVNAARDHMRKRRRRPSVPLDTGETLLDPGDGPERVALRAEQRQRVRDVIASLPAVDREVLTLRELEGSSYARMAAVLGLSAAATQSRLHRARQRLRRRF